MCSISVGVLSDPYGVPRRPCETGAVKPRIETRIVLSAWAPSRVCIDSLYEHVRRLAEEKRADEAMIFVVGKTTLAIPVIGLYPASEPVHVVRRQRVEEWEEDNVNYIVEKLWIARCRLCPLYTPNRATDVLAPPCSIRLGFYEHIAPSLRKTLEGPVPVHELADAIISEAEAYQPRLGEETVKSSLLLWARTVKELLGRNKNAVFMANC